MAKKNYTEELFIDDREEEVTEEREIPPEVLEEVRKNIAERKKQIELKEKINQQSKQN